MELNKENDDGSRHQKAYISNTSFSWFSLAFFSAISGSSLLSTLLSRCLTMSSTSCNCFGFFNFKWPVLQPPYFSNRSKNLVKKKKISQVPFSHCKSAILSRQLLLFCDMFTNKKWSIAVNVNYCIKPICCLHVKNTN